MKSQFSLVLMMSPGTICSFSAKFLNENHTVSIHQCFCVCLLVQRPAEDFGSEDKHGNESLAITFIFIPLIKRPFLSALNSYILLVINVIMAPQYLLVWFVLSLHFGFFRVFSGFFNFAPIGSAAAGGLVKKILETKKEYELSPSSSSKSKVQVGAIVAAVFEGTTRGQYYPSQQLPHVEPAYQLYLATLRAAPRRTSVFNRNCSNAREGGREKRPPNKWSRKV